MSMSDEMHVMIDIETLGRDADAPILQIGLVRFDSDGLHEESEETVGLRSNQEVGQWGVEADTLLWWLEQKTADHVLASPGDIESALRTVIEVTLDADAVWACSPKFDCEILEHAYRQVGLQIPWAFYDLADVRTLREWSPHWPDRKQEGPEHDALADARYQARCVRDYLAAVEEVETDA